MSGSIKVKAEDVIIFICRQSLNNFELDSEVIFYKSPFFWQEQLGAH